MRNTTFHVLSRSPERGSTNSITTIRKHTVYQHLLEYEDQLVTGEEYFEIACSFWFHFKFKLFYAHRAGRSIISCGWQLLVYSSFTSSCHFFLSIGSLRARLTVPQHHFSRRAAMQSSRSSNSSNSNSNTEHHQSAACSSSMQQQQSQQSRSISHR